MTDLGHSIRTEVACGRYPLLTAHLLAVAAVTQSPPALPPMVSPASSPSAAPPRAADDVPPEPGSRESPGHGAGTLVPYRCPGLLRGAGCPQQISSRHPPASPPPKPSAQLRECPTLHANRVARRHAGCRWALIPEVASFHQLGAPGSSKQRGDPSHELRGAQNGGGAPLQRAPGRLLQQGIPPEVSSGVPPAGRATPAWRLPGVSPSGYPPG